MLTSGELASMVVIDAAVRRGRRRWYGGGRESSRAGRGREIPRCPSPGRASSWTRTQPLLTVRRAEGGEALIPLVDEFIVDVDEDGRRIDVSLPVSSRAFSR